MTCSPKKQIQKSYCNDCKVRWNFQKWLQWQCAIDPAFHVVCSSCQLHFPHDRQMFLDFLFEIYCKRVQRRDTCREVDNMFKTTMSKQSVGAWCYILHRAWTKSELACWKAKWESDLCNCIWVVDRTRSIFVIRHESLGPLGHARTGSLQKNMVALNFIASKLSIFQLTHVENKGTPTHGVIVLDCLNKKHVNNHPGS